MSDLGGPDVYRNGFTVVYPGDRYFIVLDPDTVEKVRHGKKNPLTMRGIPAIPASASDFGRADPYYLNGRNALYWFWRAPDPASM